MKISKAITAATLAALLLVGSPSVAATPKAGTACPTANKVVKVKTTNFTCTKKGKKLVWVATAATVVAPIKQPVPAPEPSDSQTPAPAPTETPAPAPTFVALAPSATAADAWKRSGWTKPGSISTTAASATKEFKAYIATVRNPNAKVTIWAEAGTDPTLLDWVTKGGNLVASTFEVPMPMDQFNDVLATSRKFLVDTFTKLYDDRYADSQAGAFDSGNPAWGGRTSNAWAVSTIVKQDMMTRDKAGMAQTAGHEYFHAIQENYLNISGSNCGPCGTPQWFWEGPAMFVGLQTASHLGFVDYATEGRPVMVNRVTNQPTAKLKLSQVAENTPPSIDPYGIGEVATEFLVANVGMKKFVDIYRQLGYNDFPTAFEKATGVPLADFYLMFEDARADLGVPIQ